MTRAARNALRGLSLLAGGLCCALGMTGLAPAGLGPPPEPVPALAAPPARGLAFRPETLPGPEPEAAPARVALGPGGHDIRLSGELGEGTADRLARLLAAHSGVERIHLTSEGGLVDEGNALGELIAAHRLVTYVPDYCVSACTLAFVRGRERLIVASARLGFHAPYETGPLGLDIQADSGPERAAYLAAGVTADFADTALAVASGDLWIPDPARLMRGNVATGVVGTDRFPDSSLDDGPDLAHARAAALRNVPLLSAFEGRAPQVIDAVAVRALGAYLEGRSEDAVLAGMQRDAARAAARALHGASDETLLALGRLLVRAMERAGPSHPQTCVRLAETGDLVLAQRMLTGEAEARDLVRQALDDAVLPVTIEVEDTEAARLEAAATIPDPASACALQHRRYLRALSLPLPEAATALRRLIAPGKRPALEATARP
ncbi:hypothetical protein LKMONMHP_2192 [Methylobacterium organophilum]|uniref:Uncharacterized protein n=1 Tax=Methylobacterium organophilum TaxID=410 RepID=A0ABQ4T9N4_METOR|nr:hypothetical protein LKMONMHP_2192 [Methylobacterium organophilum]